MAVEPYDYQRDHRLDLLETEADIASDLARCSTCELRRVVRVAVRLLHERGDIDESTEPLTGLIVCAFLGGLLCLLLGMLLRPVADDLITPLVSFLVVAP